MKRLLTRKYFLSQENIALCQCLLDFSGGSRFDGATILRIQPHPPIFRGHQKLHIDRMDHRHIDLICSHCNCKVGFALCQILQSSRFVFNKMIVALLNRFLQREQCWAFALRNRFEQHIDASEIICLRRIPNLHAPIGENGWDWSCSLILLSRCKRATCNRKNGGKKSNISNRHPFHLIHLEHCIFPKVGLIK